MPTENQTKLAELLLSSKNTVALTGAGISVPSGIPDFRTPGKGRWTQVNPMEVAHIQVWENDPERFWDYYKERLDLVGFDPNPAHFALSTLQSKGLLGGVITQNIDGLHQKAGVHDVVEVHGTVTSLSCPNGHSYSRDEALGMFADNGVPYCKECPNQPLKPDVVLFGEMLPEAPWQKAFELVDGCDLLICIGSSLQVTPVAHLPAMVVYDDKLLVTISKQTAFDDKATISLQGEMVEELEGVLEALEIIGS